MSTSSEKPSFLNISDKDKILILAISLLSEKSKICGKDIVDKLTGLCFDEEEASNLKIVIDERESFYRKNKGKKI